MGTGGWSYIHSVVPILVMEANHVSSMVTLSNGVRGAES